MITKKEIENAYNNLINSCEWSIELPKNYMHGYGYYYEYKNELEWTIHGICAIHGDNSKSPLAIKYIEEEKFDKFIELLTLYIAEQFDYSDNYIDIIKNNIISPYPLTSLIQKTFKINIFNITKEDENNMLNWTWNNFYYKEILKRSINDLETSSIKQLNRILMDFIFWIYYLINSNND